MKSMRDEAACDVLVLLVVCDVRYKMYAGSMRYIYERLRDDYKKE